MWPFTNANALRRKHEAFAEVLGDLVPRLAQKFIKELDEATKDDRLQSKIRLSSEDGSLLMQEAIIAHLWLISKAYSPDGNLTSVLETVHRRFFNNDFTLGEAADCDPQRYMAAEQRLFSRYRTYYKAWVASEAKGGWPLLTDEILQALFQSQQPVREPLLSVWLQAYISATTSGLLTFKHKCYNP